VTPSLTDTHLHLVSAALATPARPHRAGPRRGDDQGHLDVGARADLLVLPSRPFEMPAVPDVLAVIGPLATLLDGSVIRDAPAFDP